MKSDGIQASVDQMRRLDEKGVVGSGMSSGLGVAVGLGVVVAALAERGADAALGVAGPAGQEPRQSGWRNIIGLCGPRSAPRMRER